MQKSPNFLSNQNKRYAITLINMKWFHCQTSKIFCKEANTEQMSKCCGLSAAIVTSRCERFILKRSNLRMVNQTTRCWTITRYTSGVLLYVVLGCVCRKHVNTQFSNFVTLFSIIDSNRLLSWGLYSILQNKQNVILV